MDWHQREVKRHSFCFLRYSFVLWAGLTYKTGKEKDTMVSLGPIVRYAEDLAPLIKVLVGENVSKLKLDDDVDIGNIKIFYMSENRDIFCSSMRGEMKDIFRKYKSDFFIFVLQKQLF